MNVTDLDATVDPDKRANIDAILRDTGSAIFEGEQRRRDGSCFPVEVSTQAVKLDRPYHLSIIRDITARRRGQAEITRVNRALRTLSAGHSALIRAEDEAGLLTEMCRVLVEVGAHGVAIAAFARDDAMLSVEPFAASGIALASICEHSCSWGDNEHGQHVVGRAIRFGEVQLLRHQPAALTTVPWVAPPLSAGSWSELALPLHCDSPRACGALYIASSDADAFDEAEVRLLTELAGDLSFGIRTLRIREARRQAEDKLRVSLEQTIEAIAATSEARDPYTAGHQRRVAQLATAIAQEMGLPDERIKGIRFGALIHDLGKIQIPAEILAKPTQLSRIEFELIKQHPEAGYDILKTIDFPWPVAQMVLQHHERLDGSGYPQGLKGDAITLESRILTVADVVEAIATHRPYRPSLGIESALAEIEAKRGCWYDAQVVDACLRLFREKGLILGKS